MLCTIDERGQCYRCVLPAAVKLVSLLQVHFPFALEHSDVLWERRLVQISRDKFWQRTSCVKEKERSLIICSLYYYFCNLDVTYISEYASHQVFHCSAPKQNGII